jgi:hypothetical protein
MNHLFRVLLVLIACCGSTFAAAGVIHSRWANSDPRLDTNPMSSFWRGSEPIYMESDAPGKTEPKYRTEIRTREAEPRLSFRVSLRRTREMRAVEEHEACVCKKNCSKQKASPPFEQGLRIRAKFAALGLEQGANLKIARAERG